MNGVVHQISATVHEGVVVHRDSPQCKTARPPVISSEARNLAKRRIFSTGVKISPRWRSSKGHSAPHLRNIWNLSPSLFHKTFLLQLSRERLQILSDPFDHPGVLPGKHGSRMLLLYASSWRQSSIRPRMNARA